MGVKIDSEVTRRRKVTMGMGVVRYREETMGRGAVRSRG